MIPQTQTLYLKPFSKKNSLPWCVIQKGAFTVPSRTKKDRPVEYLYLISWIQAIFFKTEFSARGKG